MKKSQLLVSFLILFTVFACTSPEPAIIEISEDMVINESGSGDMMAWFDEQDLETTPTTRWRTEGMTTFWPAGLVINLGRKYKITEVWIYDGPKENHIEGGQLILASGKPFEWENLKPVNIQNSTAWTKIDWAAETQYIQLQKNATIQFNIQAEFPQNSDLAINEIILVGYPVESEIAETKKTEHVSFNIPMDQFIGMNSYIHTPDKVHEAIGCAREYRPWRWNGVTDLETPINWGDINNNGAKNEYAGVSIGNSDLYYKKMKDMGVECIPCIHRHVDESKEHENIPSFGGDSNDPLTYKIMADYTFQFVARYGGNPVPESLLRTTEISPKKSGLGYIRYFENWNEPNRWWGNPEGHFTPYQFAAFCSSSYDGHLNQMGEGFGAKNADPEIKFVFGGLAAISLHYVQAMKLWSDYYRNGSFPSDVINLHHYCNTRSEQHPKEEAHGISPEEDKLKEKLEKVVKWRDKNLPGKEVWLSEFGWDTDENTYQSAARGHKLYPEKITMEEIQGQWLTRAFLIGAAAGLDRMMMFLANDLKNYPHGVYGSCGFITVDEEYKPSWYYVKTLKNALAGMVFMDEFPSENENVWIYRFKNLQSGEGAYVLWCPTADGTAVENYALKISTNSTTLKKTMLAHKNETGINEDLNLTDGIIRLDVSERPVIVLVDSL
jgi:hypothetical protein